MVETGRRRDRANIDYPTIAIVLLVAMLVFSSIVFLEIKNIKNELEGEQSGLPGESAQDYLQHSPYRSLLVECDSFMTAFTLDMEKIFTEFENIVREECDKDGISYSWDFDQDTNLVRENYTFSNLLAIADATKDFSKGRGTCVIHILFMNGEYRSNPEYIGIALDGMTIALFPEDVYSLEVSFAIAHEMGHLLGLVGMPSLYSSQTSPDAASHYDYDNPGHCTNVDCIMQANLIQFTDLCDDCKDDLAYMRDHPY